MALRLASLLLLLLLLLLAAPARAADAWRLLDTLKLDPLPAGRYTQTRLAADKLVTAVWNGDAGLRLARCADATCSAAQPPHTVAGTDPNPRFIRMEMDGSLPVMAYGAANDTEAHLTRCHDPLCTTSTTVVLAKSERVRHCDLLLADADGEAIVTVGLSDKDASESSNLVIVTAQRNGSVSKPVIIATNPKPFAVNDTTNLPTGGLEMPHIIPGLTPEDASHVVYWDVAYQCLKLVFEATGPEPRTVVAAKGFDIFGAVSSPGGWARAVRTPGGGPGSIVSHTITIAYFDLPAGVLAVLTCDEQYQDCTKPKKIDLVGHKDVSDFGAGAFPEFRQLPGMPGPMLAYFSEVGTGAQEQGLLKLMSCSSPNCTTASVATLAVGHKGFGRDCSLEMVGDEARPLLLVSFLDLQGKDDPSSMAARLAVLGRE